MVQDRQCDFCGNDIEPGTGTMFVRTNGATIHYCSSKCEKNHDLGREARDLEWAGERDEDQAADEDDLEDEPEGEPVSAGGADEESGAEDATQEPEASEPETGDGNEEESADGAEAPEETDRDDEETEAEA